jgi:lipopolysaccharide/colanic/teichoic acid biosynthesis glycosyltransferase
MLLAALLIRMDSRGPVFFKQRRLGRDMKAFTVLKFRTMKPEASHELHQRYVAQLARDEGAVSQGNGLKKLTGDPRVTRIGHVLRALSVDELPQLFNVLAGDMSLVGPRPALEYELEHYCQDHFARFKVRPGLTGLWQVSGRSSLGFTEMLELDAVYANEATLSADLKILARTPLAAFRHAA